MMRSRLAILAANHLAGQIMVVFDEDMHVFCAGDLWHKLARHVRCNSSCC